MIFSGGERVEEGAENGVEEATNDGNPFLRWSYRNLKDAVEGAQGERDDGDEFRAPAMLAQKEVANLFRKNVGAVYGTPAPAYGATGGETLAAYRESSPKKEEGEELSTSDVESTDGDARYSDLGNSWS